MTIERESFTPLVRKELERACKEFTALIAPHGFARTRKMLWTRRYLYTADFIHFHRHGSTYGAPVTPSVDIRIELGIRVLNSSFEALALNGLTSGPDLLRAGRYHLRFNARSGHMFERCVHDLARFVTEQGLPWFERYRDEGALLTDRDSPLSDDDRKALSLAMNDATEPDNVKNSLKLLGL